MPHCLATQIECFALPCVQDGYVFEYEVSNPKGESLIFVRFERYEFFIHKRYRHKHQDYILKCKKISAGIPTGIIKGALRILAKHNQKYLISHNLNNDSLRSLLVSPFLKQIEDFLSFDEEFELEIGFGSGRHILQKAQQNPNRLFIGIELYTPSIEQVLNQINLLGLQNLWIVNFDARIFLELLPSNLCHALYVHFPVPWHKKPHRRVWSAGFVQEALRVLREGGKLELRTDDEEYFADAYKILMNEGAFGAYISKNIDKEVVSKYEGRWRRMQKSIYEMQMYALDTSPQKILDLQFDFCALKEVLKEKALGEIAKSFAKISAKKVLQKSFLHINDLYLNQDRCILALSFGDFSQPQSKYVLLEKDEVVYLGGNPLPTEATHSAHFELVQLLRSCFERHH
ncbi:tRNA (guanosine(46)-N7)-methyltransferase TrmB [Helicobacter enhydrae]|uniref:tRNA (guanine-N(7)-)-methyltransferase n=1 Tax=Helicobacter enhydrae TaxID=222136 RepID=A0A1B1U494_9HELI|nr:tRNA (guanosine(46)-N7)-methyltransferase TrmB [Helicobacter enhydrae]ANV97583.1 tRNA (guanosine(46)-N7)-methyltransferase TrmB [Helicobacter enhydrae]